MAKNTLISESYVYVVDALCEGTIEGFAPSTGIVGNYNTGVLPYKSIYFDNVPILDKFGRLNYPMTGSYALSFASGTSGQAAMVGYENVEIPLELPQNLEVSQRATYNGSTIIARDYKSVVVSFNTRDYPEANYLKCNLRVPALYHTDSDGSIDKDSIAFELFCSVNDAARTSLTNGWLLIEGKTSNPYYKTVQVNLPTGSQTYNKYVVTVERSDVDREDPKVQNRLFVDSLFVGCRSKLKYPYTALAAWTFDSDQYGTTPQRKYNVKGIKVKIPDNYNPETRKYTGNWTGTFATEKAWTQNPAWIYYDLITNSRYGLGNYFREELIDKWTLYEIAQYCDEMVDDGNGGMEPRFTCNVVIYTAEEAYSLLQKFVSVFRGMMYWSNGRIFVTQDSYSDPVYNFTNANVVDGVFTYTSSAQNVRHTAVLVRWTDPDNMYKESVEVVQDPDGILKYGYNETEVVAFACTSKGQAIRVGKWLLTSEILLTEAVSFRTGLDGIYIKPGDIVNIFDNDRLNAQQGGRVITYSANRSFITIDRPVDILTGYRYNLSIITPSGNLEATGDITSSTQINDIRKSQITTITLTGSPELRCTQLRASGSYPDSLYTGAIWVLDAYRTGNLSDSVKSLQYKILTTKEVDQNVVEVFALDYNTGKFNFVETGYSVVSVPTYTGDGSPINPPTNLVISQITGVFDDIYQSYLRLEWTGTTSSNLSYYNVSGKVRTGAWELLTNTPTTIANKTTSVSGYYYFNIRAVSLGGVYSSNLSGSYYLATGNPFGGPPAITGLSVIEDYDNTTTGFIGLTPTFGWSVVTGADGVEDARSIFLSGYRLSILHTGNNSLQYGPIITKATEPYYELASNRLTSLPSGHQRAIRILVQPYDIDGNVGTGISGIFNNPALVSSYSLFNGTFGSIQYNISKNSELDPSGVIIWYTGTPFNPTFESGVRFESPNYAGTFTTNITGINYIYYSPIDTFGKSGSYIYGPYTAAPATSYVSGLRIDNVVLGGNIGITGSNGTNVAISGNNIVINSPNVRFKETLEIFTPRTGTCVTEYINKNSFTLTGFVANCYSTLSTAASGEVYYRTFANGAKTSLGFSIGVGSATRSSNLLSFDIPADRRVGVDFISFGPEFSGFSIGLFGT